jgi:hypothetical protein
MTTTTKAPNGQGPPTDPSVLQSPPSYGPGPPDVPPQDLQPRWYRRGWVIGLGALLVGIGLGGAAGASKTAPRAATVTAPAKTVVHTAPGATKTKTVVRNVPGPTKTVTQTAPVATPPAANGGGGGSAGGQHFSGTDTQNLGTITLAADSTLRWTCPGCSSANFIIQNDFGDANTIAVNSLDQTSGQTVVSAGTYTKVTVTGSGDWSFDITPGT